MKSYDMDHSSLQVFNLGRFVKLQVMGGYHLGEDRS